VSDSTIITRQPAWGDALIRQPTPSRVLTRQPFPVMDYAINARFVDGAGAPAGFDASTYGTLISWVSASQGTYTDSASVATLADESGNGNTFAAAAGSDEATFLAGPPKRFNFDGDDHYQAASSAAWDVMHQTVAGGGAGGGTIVWFARFASGADGDSLVTTYASRFTSGNGLGIYYSGTLAATGRLRVCAGTSSITNSADHNLPALPGTDWHSYILSVDAEAAEWQLYYDGSALGSAVSFTQDDGASAVAPILGADPRGFALYEFTGDVGEVITYEGALSSGTVSSLHTALMGTVS
jgi:hypothetical protein